MLGVVFGLMLVSGCAFGQLNVPDVRQLNRVTCAATAATAILNYWGYPVSYGEFAGRLTLGAAGVSMFQVEELALGYGFESLVCRIEPTLLPALIRLEAPVLVNCLTNGVKHAVVVCGWTGADSSYVLMDPELGRTTVGRVAFDIAYQATDYQALLLFPRNSNWLEEMVRKKLPVRQWLAQNQRYRSEQLCFDADQSRSDMERALLFAQAVTEDPTNARAGMHYVQTLEKLGLRDRAFQERQKVRMRHTKDPEVQRWASANE